MNSIPEKRDVMIVYTVLNTLQTAYIGISFRGTKQTKALN
jgi:hypothetical protein